MIETRHPDDGPVSSSPGYTLGDLVRYALQLGTLGFGGPVALVGFIRRGPAGNCVG